MKLRKGLLNDIPGSSLHSQSLGFCYNPPFANGAQDKCPQRSLGLKSVDGHSMMWCDSFLFCMFNEQNGALCSFAQSEEIHERRYSFRVSLPTVQMAIMPPLHRKCLVYLSLIWKHSV